MVEGILREESHEVEVRVAMPGMGVEAEVIGRTGGPVPLILMGRVRLGKAEGQTDDRAGPTDQIQSRGDPAQLVVIAPLA